MDAEDFKEMRQEKAARRQKHQKSNTELVLLYQGDLEYDFEVQTIAEYHLRLFKDKKKLDYFPQRGRATWVGSNKYFTIPDIEKFIMAHFKIKQQEG